MNNFKYLLIVSEWPIAGCRKVQSFNTLEAAVEAGAEFLSTHPDAENKILVIHGEIMDIGFHQPHTPF